MTTKTIQSLGETRVWKSEKGPVPFIPVLFTDGEKGEVRSTPEAEPKRRGELEAIVGKAGDFELEDGGKWGDGNPKPWKIRDYPGKPKGKEGGGGKSSWYNSEEGVRFTQDLTNRRTALMQAIALADKPDAISKQMPWPDSICAVADRFYAWLTSSDASSPPLDSQASERGRAAVGGGPSPQPSGDDLPDSEQAEAPGKPSHGEGESGSKASACSHSRSEPAKEERMRQRGWFTCLDCGLAFKPKVPA